MAHQTDTCFNQNQQTLKHSYKLEINISEFLKFSEKRSMANSYHLQAIQSTSTPMARLIKRSVKISTIFPELKKANGSSTASFMVLQRA